MYNKETQTYDQEDFDQLRAANGKFSHLQMFWELNHNEDKFRPLWTLKDREHKGLPSAYKVYMSCVDEYEAGIKICGSAGNWEKLLENNMFMTGDKGHGHLGLETWRRHMAMRDASMAKRVIMKNTKAGQTTAANSLKDIAKGKAPKGRKPKQEKLDKGLASRIAEFKRK